MGKQWKCETCRDTGEVDETLGGEPTSNPHAPCPDCVAPVINQRYVIPKVVAPKPAACLCRLLACIGVKCREHRNARR